MNGHDIAPIKNRKNILIETPLGNYNFQAELKFLTQIGGTVLMSRIDKTGFAINNMAVQYRDAYPDR